MWFVAFMQVMRMLSVAGMAALVLGVLTLTGCGGGGAWLEGTWVFDEAFTEKQFKAQEKAAKAGEESSSLASDAQQFLQGFGQGMATGAMQDSEMTFTGTEAILTVRETILSVEGAGKARSYKVVKASPSEVTLQFTNGDAATYKLVDGHLAAPVKISGSTITLFYKRK